MPSPKNRSPYFKAQRIFSAAGNLADIFPSFVTGKEKTVEAPASENLVQSPTIAEAQFFS
jgi:hypothetical protein